MSEIPDDIKRAAYDAALNYRYGIATDPRLREGPIDPIHNDAYLADCFERAIFTERQRAAPLKALCDEMAKALENVINADISNRNMENNIWNIKYEAQLGLAAYRKENEVGNG